MMIENAESKVNDQRKSFIQGVKDKIPLLFMIWLVLSVLAPHQDLYKAFFHLIIMPAVFILIFTGQSDIDWKDSFFRIAIFFFAYAAISTFDIGMGPVESHLRALRWSVEITFGLLGLYIWMPRVVEKPAWWGRFFLWMALLGGGAAIILFFFFTNTKGRLTGFGALHNAVQISSILMMYAALGVFLLSRVNKSSFKDNMLQAVTLLIVCLTVFLSQSRANIGALVIYALFLVLTVFYSKPKRDAFYITVFSLLSFALLLILLSQFFGTQNFIDKLMARGLSHRIDIWKGYILYPPESWLLGFGAGTDPEFLSAAKEYWRPNGIPLTHTHNLLLGTLVKTGIIGLGFLSTLFFLVIRSIFTCKASKIEKVRLLGILGLIFMLTSTASHTMVSSIKAIWLFLWIPLIFIWFWCRSKSDKLMKPDNT